MPSFKYAKKQLCGTAALLERKASIPQVREKLPLLKEIQTDTFWEAKNSLLFERARRALIQFLVEGVEGRSPIITKLTPILEQKEGTWLDVAYDLEDYRAKVNRYVNEHGDTPFGLLIWWIAKLDHEAAMEAFSRFINDQPLNPSRSPLSTRSSTLWRPTATWKT